MHADGNVTIHEVEIERPYPNTALLSMCLMFGCFFIAYFLRMFKNGHYLPGPVRPQYFYWRSKFCRLGSVILTFVHR